MKVLHIYDNLCFIIALKQSLHTCIYSVKWQVPFVTQ